MENLEMNSEMMRQLLQAKDRCLSVYDEFRFDLKRKDGGEVVTFDKLKETITILNSLIKDYIDTMPYFFEIVATENIVIKNEETVEIKTNITGQLINAGEREFIFYGSIPSGGKLSLSSELTDGGVKIYARNDNSREMDEKYDLCVYHYNCPTDARSFGPGAYLIEKGQVIGIGIKHYVETNRIEYVDDEMSTWPEWKREAAGAGYGFSRGLK